MPRPKRQANPLVSKYLNAIRPTQTEANNLGELKPVEPAARRGDGAPLLGNEQVYVMKYGTKYHTVWCKVVAEKWEHSPRGLLVTWLSDVGGRARCKECDRPPVPAKPPLSATGRPGAGTNQVIETQEPTPPDEDLIPLKVVGLSHGILFLAAGPEHRERLKETAIEPSTPLSVDGRRDGMVVRLDATKAEPLLVVQMDPRATFMDVPYQMRLRPPLRRSATKPYAVASVEPVSPK
ncbi:hypothetical protein [Arthrobacter sp. M4]|uniref:hypothetical protein n=1 Tax=Arthrobacter sp. M4 TaxID=218160 RepID=UPI001CDD55C0|nr:hypothetical protein [Arthrobacter sp. M4]MCA4132808.1 hypothetical protein [Arthrobacter sp. M4]